jgi:hypothetical protein
MTETIVGTVRATDLGERVREAIRVEADRTIVITITVAEDGSITLYPPGVEIHEDDSWLHTPEWQDKIRRAEEELQQGHGQDAMTEDEFLTQLDADLWCPAVVLAGLPAARRQQP